MVYIIAIASVLLAGVGSSRAEASSAHVRVRQGDKLDRQRKTGEALEQYLAAERLQPGNVAILLKIVKQYADMINDVHTPEEQRPLAQKSLEYAKRALSLEPDNADANLAMAVALCKMTPYLTVRQKVEICNEVKAYSERAIALNPTSDYAHHVLGRWHQEVSQVSGVEKALAKALFGGLPKADLKVSLAQLDEARKLRPDRLIHQVEYGRTLYMMGRREEGRREIEKGLAMPTTEKDDPEAKARGKRTLAAAET